VADRQNPPPDRDDPITERAVSMDTRPLDAGAGAGRAINAAFSRNRTTAAAGGGGVGGSVRDDQKQADGQQDDFQGAGYPSKDIDDVAPEDQSDDDDGYRKVDTGDEDQGTGDDRPKEEDPEGLETGDGILEALITPPSGDALGGDRDTDPNLNGGHGIRMQAPEEGDLPIELEDSEDSLIGHGHEDKAAWNRERVAHLQEIEHDERDLRPATSEQTGMGGAALAGELQGWEGGNASPTIDQGDTEFDPELSEEEEVLGDLAMEDMPEDVMRDASIRDPNNTPELPEFRDHPDDNMSLEELLVATPGEDPISAGAEIGINEELDMEDLNQTDNIEGAWENARFGLDDAMDGNERRGGLEDEDGR
jgi:hypothetical protein